MTGVQTCALPISWSWLDSSTSRQTTFGYDFRNRQTSVSGPENSWSGSTYSNLNQLTEQVSRNGSAAAVLLSKNVTVPVAPGVTVADRTRGVP